MMGFEVAQKWYERRRMSDELTLIYEPHVHPFLRCNIWHVRGRDTDLLIDTGLGAAPLKPAIEDILDKEVMALATHIHYDHVGCLHEFDHRLMHSSEADRMSAYKEFCWLRVDDFPREYREALKQESFDDYLVNAIPHEDFDPATYHINSTTITQQLEEGDVLDLGDRYFEIFHLPGHSPGSIGLWDKKSATLFSGDALYDGELLDQLVDSSIPDYIHTMKRLRSLPVSVVHGGHEGSFGRPRMIELIDAYLNWREG